MSIKSLDDLSDAPLPTTPIPTPAAKRWIGQAEILLSDARYHFAGDTIERMYDWVRANGVVTTAMETALNNIETSVTDREDRPRGGSRRYEGHRRW